MSDQTMTATEVAQHLAELARQLASTVQAMDQAERDAINRREDYTMAHSRAYLSAEGSIEARKHHAVVKTHAERLAAEVAEQLVKGLRRQIDSIKIRIDVGRSMGAAVRSEIALGQSGWSES